ncbi:MAG: hypothetical protein HC866_14555 [Leptolyngbyaceae cyanobacterium RU_5_1]|nr:hypothetical protein [Leptolyngbyaceae cyanobacterium RU_5_1]
MITRQVLTEVTPPNSDLIKDAEVAIANFETSIAPSVWTFLDKAIIVSEVRSRVHNPFLINQGGQPFCGPAAVLFELIRKQPIRYVEICQTLLLTGGFNGTTQFILASDKLRRASRGNLRMGQADWMVLATLREMENILFPVEPNTPDLIRNLAGMTKSWEMKGWVREILGYQKVDYDHAYLVNDIQSITEAATVIQAGGVAFALITAEGMLSDTPPPIPFPSHWIALLGNLSIQGNAIGFDIYTWSKKMRLQMDINSFKKYFWATVTGLP